MTPEMWVILGVFLGLGAGILLASTRPEYRVRAIRALSRSVGLAIPVELESSIRNRVLGRRRGGIVGAMVGGLIAAAVLELWTIPSTLASVLLPAGVFAGVAVGVAIAALRYSRRLTDEQPRFARAVVVKFSDFIAPLEHWGARACVILAVVLLAFSIAWGASKPHASIPSALALAGVLTAAAVIFLLLFETLGRRIVGRGSPSASPTELAWDDALRSTAVRDLASAPIALALYAVIAALLELPPTFGMDYGLHNIILNVSMIVLIYGAAALTVVYVITKPQRHFLRRQWPELVAQTAQPHAANAVSPRPTDAEG